MVALSSSLSLVLALALSLVTPLARAANACTEGVWLGTLGGTPISMQFKLSADDAKVGRYYYRASLADLFLKQDPATGEWQEQDERGKATGRLRLTCTAERLQGEWTSVDGARHLPVEARPAGEDQYPAARRPALQPTVKKTGSFQKHRFEVMSYGSRAGGTEGLRLVGTGAGLDAINAALREQASEAVSEHLDCASLGIMEHGPGGGYSTMIWQTLQAWNDSFVVVRTGTDAYCGGAYPSNGSATHTYRLDTGAPVETSTWLLPAYRSEIPDKSPLQRLLLKTYEAQGLGPDWETCKDEISWQPSALYGAPGKLVFATLARHAVQPCQEDLAVPLADIQRFLSPEGKQALSAFR